MAELVDLAAQLLAHFSNHMKPEKVEAPGDGGSPGLNENPTGKDTPRAAMRKVPSTEVFDL
jgi:hypothetical protein